MPLTVANLEKRRKISMFCLKPCSERMVGGVWKESVGFSLNNQVRLTELTNDILPYNRVKVC